VAEIASVSEGQEAPHISVRPPGPASRGWLERAARASAPMGPKSAGSAAIVYAQGSGSNVVDVDGNRYVDLAAGFGAMLLGHGHPELLRVLDEQGARLCQALGDVYPADAKIALVERLAALHPSGAGQVILGLAGADAVSAALKSAVLCSGRPGLIAFRGGYHGLSYGPLAACGLRASYREPFLPQLNPHVQFLDYPADSAGALRTLDALRRLFESAEIGAVIVEPILGRGGCVVPPPEFLPELAALAQSAGALTIADEIWTGLGRSGQWLCSSAWSPDLICLGKGLGGGLPLSACIGSAQVMSAWRRSAEVVHTQTFSGAPLGCANALATLDVLAQDDLVSRAERVGARFKARLAEVVEGVLRPSSVRGQGLMLGVDVAGVAGGAGRVQRALLERGYIVSTGGGEREVLVLTPPLNISEALLDGFALELESILQSLSP
jgi:4-aminobutyrate aminotransferase / (S)-3-amino-2-methylpropionate transaminase / 5-aminovalerate transaminase